MLQSDLDEAAPPNSSQPHSLLKAFAAQPSVFGWSFAYFCFALGLYGLGFWIPTVLASHGMELKSLGWATALPYLAAIVAMILWSRSSDRHRERRYHLVAAYLAAAAGFLVRCLCAQCLCRHCWIHHSCRRNSLCHARLLERIDG